MRVRIGVLAVLAACAPAEDADTGSPAVEDGCATGEIAVDVGTGDDLYVPLSDGDTITMVHGPQGGWHVETGGIVTNSEPEIAILPRIFSASLGIDVTGALQPEYKALAGYDDTSCNGSFYGTRAFVDTDRLTGPTGQDFVCSMAGEVVTFSVLVSDIVDLREGTDEVDVVLALDPADVKVCP